MFAGAPAAPLLAPGLAAPADIGGIAGILAGGGLLALGVLVLVLGAAAPAAELAAGV
jgi:hypothetical protein